MQSLEGLNEAQKRAVLHAEGPLLVVAGAGAGKTKTIVHRILRLIETGVAPPEILAITFTNKAAEEMRSRVTEALERRPGGEAPLSPLEAPMVRTFHSLGVYILKEEAKAAGLPRHFGIADESEAISLIKEALVEQNLDPKQFEPRRMKSLISREKGDFVTPEAFAANAEGYFPKILANVWRRYEEKLRGAKALDFDDLILKTVTLLARDEALRKKYETKWRYLHIDEYQDTNVVQYELSKLLAGGHRNICVVGDSDQNIYGWRGANLRNIMNFEKDYPGARVVLLEENYRSTQNILAAANEVIRKNTVRKEKTLFTRRTEGEKIGLFEAFDEEDEARFVAGTMAALAKKGVPYKKMAVLYRANFQSRAFEEALFARGVPYQVLGVRFFERKEVKDALSYLRLAMGGESAIDLRRALENPRRGIGKSALAKILSGKEEELPPKGKEALAAWRKIIDALRAERTILAPSLLVKEMLKRSGLEATLGAGTEEEKERLENMHELATIAARYDSLPKPEGLEKFLEDAALFSEQDSLKEGGESAKLLTVHSAKGLEFSHVFIVGLEQDLFPHAKPLEHVEKEDEEEERRLFYVALTRAEEKLYLSFAMMRTIFGSKQVNEPSEFIFDIPPDLLEKEVREESGKVVYLE